MSARQTEKSGQGAASRGDTTAKTPRVGRVAGHLKWSTVTREQWHLHAQWQGRKLSRQAEPSSQGPRMSYKEDECGLQSVGNPPQNV